MWRTRSFRWKSNIQIVSSDFGHLNTLNWGWEREEKRRERGVGGMGVDEREDEKEGELELKRQQISQTETITLPISFFQKINIKMSSVEMKSADEGLGLSLENLGEFLPQVLTLVAAFLSSEGKTIMKKKPSFVLTFTENIQKPSSSTPSKNNLTTNSEDYVAF